MDGGHLPLRSSGRLQWERGRLEGHQATYPEKGMGVLVPLAFLQPPQGLPWQHGSEKTPG